MAITLTRTTRLGLLCFLVASVPAPAHAAGPGYPGKTWQRVAAPEKVGWSRAKLDEAREFAIKHKSAAAMVVVGGKVIYQWGETARKYDVHSIRKSFLSALYGIHVRAKRIDLSQTMADLGIDDNAPSLTPTEKKATLHDLIKARSGIYHPALFETPYMKLTRPKRGSHLPGEFFYYNNWDFNVLGSAFERLVKNSIFRDFKERIADPIGMQDFSQRLRARLYFRVKEKLLNDYRIFVHVEHGCSRLNADHELLGTSMRQWQRGDYVTDTFEVKVDPMTVRGTWTMSMGLWPGGNGPRVKVTTGPNDGNRVRLGTMQIR